MMGDGFLHKYFMNNGNLRLHKWIHYFDIYERHFERYRGKDVVMMEIGVAGGGSLAMWKAYFGKKSKVIGVDINPDCKSHETEGIEIFIGSQDDTKLLDSITDKYPNVDIVLDDGSHKMSHMITTFEYLYGKIDIDGVYVVEDTHTCYWPHYNGGVKRIGTFIEFVKDRIDDINAAHTKGSIPVTEFTRSTDCLSIYDSIVVFEKRPQGHRMAPVTIGMGLVDPGQ